MRDKNNFLEVLLVLTMESFVVAVPACALRRRSGLGGAARAGGGPAARRRAQHHVFVFRSWKEQGEAPS